MRVLLYQLDGALPNIALMRISTHHKERGDFVMKYTAGNISAIDRSIGDDFDRVYASLIFHRTRSLAEYLKSVRPDAIIGGTGWDWDNLVGLGAPSKPAVTLESVGIKTRVKDYSIYRTYEHSIGYTQRGCRMNSKTCPWCCVPIKEGKIAPDEALYELWRGAPHPRNLHLLDNDFFGNPNWRALVIAMRDGKFKINFNQGVNIRLMDEEQCEAIASLRYYGGKDFQSRRFYTAWDNRADEERLFRGLRWLVKYGMKPDHLMVYMLIGFHLGETSVDRDYRRQRLRDFGARPYPMPYIRSKELVGFQRWVIGAYDKPSRQHPYGISWSEWEAADYRPENMGILVS